MDTNKLRAKDLITTGIFTVVFTLIVMVVSLTLGMIPVVYPFIVAIGMIPCGIVWAYMRAKVPKRFGILIQCTVLALFLLLTGMGWYGVLGVFVGGVLAEIIAGIGNYRSFKLTVLSYAVFGLCFDLGGFLVILLAGDYYYKNSIALGADTAYMDALMNFMSGPVLAVACVLTVIGAVVGMLLGKAMLKKHFVKAGIV
ncbi:MAG: MptD family putative ECF transporter S component [Coriobacteriales bacterium]|nr:MptD family putative ECF transporter S component [Coriobacteriales bacterium]